MVATEVRPREGTDLNGAARTLESVYSTDGYPVEGVSEPVLWLSPPGLCAAWVATLDHSIVGHVLVTEPSLKNAAVETWASQQHGHADSIAIMARLFVDAGARGHGLGQRLTAAATAWATQNGRRLVLDVLDKDQAAMRMYERLGWRRFGSAIYENASGAKFVEYLYVSPPLSTVP